MTQYETLYGVTLLDDLHNYFPALLYDSSSFSSVADILNYVQRQARNRFDLFSYGQRDYQTRYPRSVRQNPVVPTQQVLGSGSASLQNTIPRGQHTANIQTYAGRPTTTPTPILTPSVMATIAPMFGIVETEQEEDNLSNEEQDILRLSQVLLQTMGVQNPQQQRINPLLQAFTLPGMGNRRANPAMDAFLQPVIVRPTPEQIAAHTSLGNLVSDTEHTCAICQDALTSEQEGRKLNACGHWFHRPCIDTWFQRDVHCPVCRHDIREPLPAV
jgi:hypothetical protein